MPKTRTFWEPIPVTILEQLKSDTSRVRLCEGYRAEFLCEAIREEPRALQPAMIATCRMSEQWVHGAVFN